MTVQWDAERANLNLLLIAGGSVVKWTACQTRNPAVPGSSSMVNQILNLQLRLSIANRLPSASWRF